MDHLACRYHPTAGRCLTMAEREKARSVIHRAWWWFKPDWLFLFLLSASIVILVTGGLKDEPITFVPPPLFPKLAALIGAMVILSAIAAVGAKLDRRHLDDYMFQMIANGAVIGIISTIFLKMIWEVGKDVLPPITSDDLMAVLVGSWSLGYFFYRWRGLNE